MKDLFFSLARFVGRQYYSLITDAPLQFSNDPLALAEWFVASVALVLVVTLIYVLVLKRSAPPEGPTAAKLDQTRAPTSISFGSSAQALSQADAYIAAGNLGNAVEASASAISIILKSLVGQQLGSETEGLGITDLAYIVQTRFAYSAQIAQPIYQLNNLRLQAIRGQGVSQPEAAWSVSFAKWLQQAVASNQIRT